MQHDAPHAHDTHRTHHGALRTRRDGVGGGSAWSVAARATLHCLTGCAIGEILGMVVGTALGWGDVQTLLLAVVLAFLFGYALTLRSVIGNGLGLRAAVRVALAADTASIAVMELVDNGVIALWPGAMDAGLTDGLFWTVLALALATAFVATTPLNKWMIGRGKGHAVAHRHHH
ncbi:DUF4396 domain-containing protein [Streptomyces atroolivaceus]|uniref:DUF4396 domain-containing protein n=1 Tax=Streptomyces atroolivaceus TaxID=66869 RepID=A0ABV9V554_STRAZ|nr:DUF4396 domain-containing protein [Streptomyces atroolivaceus]